MKSLIYKPLEYLAAVISFAFSARASCEMEELGGYQVPKKCQGCKYFSDNYLLMCAVHPGVIQDPWEECLDREAKDATP